MKIKKAASIPLVLHDPFFSIWSAADHLNDCDTVHWSGIRQKMRGYVTVDGVMYCFMGDPEFHAIIEQKSLAVTATATEYVFDNEKITLTLRFTSPLLLNDMTILSRPCTYVDLTVEKKEICDVYVDFMVSSDLVQQEKDAVIGVSYLRPAKGMAEAYHYASMGRAKQEPLNGSGDLLTIDWGYVYLASQDGVPEYDKRNTKLECRLEFRQEKAKKSLVLAYDDLLSISYFGQWRKAYWTKTYDTILDAIGASFADKEDVLLRAAKLDEQVEKMAKEAGGDNYAFLCNMSYRHAIAAHKLVADEAGEVLFLSKENNSNGCIGTVDISYPSSPLFLLYDTEYVKGMMRPVFRFAACDVWEYDFAPHDVGRYPYVAGQVYSLNEKKEGGVFLWREGTVYPPFYQYPAGGDIYEIKWQMPVEECGNMIILAGAVSVIDGNADFAAQYMPQLRQWVQYLLIHGSDPGSQLCTDDFAGHLSHNVNLSAKAIMGIEAFSQILRLQGEAEEAEEYHRKATEMATDWEKRAAAEDHYMLAFGKPDTWSLKYNIIWDKFFGSHLFSEEVYEKELAYYIKKTNRFGTPLDSRKEYTKSDWILWCAAMTEEKEAAEKLIAPIADYLENTTTRVPFSDWYETVDGTFCSFRARSVQGGLFMPILIRKQKKTKS